MEWTTERRYRRYEDWSREEKQAIQDLMAKSPWHTHYHVEPKAGLLNDPNGFSYFNDEYHVFYQSYPFGAVHGLKSWVANFFASALSNLTSFQKSSCSTPFRFAFFVSFPNFIFLLPCLRSYNLFQFSHRVSLQRVLPVRRFHCHV